MTTKNIIKTDTAPKAIGAYSQAVETEKLLFTSGQIPLDPKTGNLVSEDFELQVRQVFNNLESILKSQGLTLNNILKLTVYMVDLNDFEDVLQQNKVNEQ